MFIITDSERMRVKLQIPLKSQFEPLNGYWHPLGQLPFVLSHVSLNAQCGLHHCLQFAPNNPKGHSETNIQHQVNNSYQTSYSQSNLKMRDCGLTINYLKTINVYLKVVCSCRKVFIHPWIKINLRHPLMHMYNKSNSGS